MKVRPYCPLGFLLFAIFISNPVLLQAQLIDVNFTQNSSAGTGGPNPGPTMSGAAAVGSASDQWNGINGSSGTGISLKYATGSTSPVTMTFTAGGGYNVYNYAGTTPFTGTKYCSLMENYLYNSGTPRTITLSGLTPNSTYNLALYNGANTNAVGRTTYFTVNGKTLSSTWNGSASTFVPNVDYVYFSSVTSDGSGNLAITYTGNGTAEGDIDGFQLQFVSGPSFLINAAHTGANVSISFMTQSGFNYQVQYKNTLASSSWISLGNPVSGNNATQSVNDSPNVSSRFYRVVGTTNSSLIVSGPVGLSMLRAQGTNIVNASGTVVQLKGLNLGGWFIMEPWMCPADSGGLPDTYSIINELDSRFGVATEQNLIRAYQTNWITTADLDNIANAGFNCVRVPVWWGNFYPIANPTSSGWRSDAFTMLDWVVTNCAARGIYIIIDMHGVVGGQSTSDDTGQQNQNAYWNSSTDQSETAYTWAQIAAHYNGNGTVAGYDLINEPIGAPGTNALWSIYNSLYNTIRGVDTNHIIIMENTFGAWSLSMLPNPSTYGWTNIVYSWHEYASGTVAQVEAGADGLVWDFKSHSSWNVPGYVGEWNDMGLGAACYDYSTNDYNSAGLAWTMWAYKAADGLVPDGWGWYDPIYMPPTPNVSTDSISTILSDWQQWQTTNSFTVNPALGL